jgi:hypothetical protein
MRGKRIIERGEDWTIEILQTYFVLKDSLLRVY